MSTAPEQFPHDELFADLLAQGFRIEGLGPLLRSLRTHLGMDVAFYSRFRSTDRVLEYVDAAAADAALYTGQVLTFDQGFCFKVANGTAPELIPDTALLPAADVIPEIRSLPIGSHLSVPIRLRSGSLYGTLCCFRHQADPSLGERDLHILRVFADLLVAQIERNSEATHVRHERLELLRRVMTATSPRIVFQPIYDLKAGLLSGMECLSRFTNAGTLTPSEVFDTAQQVGLRTELEALSLRRALAVADALPQWVQLGFNSSPETILSGALAQTLGAQDLSRFVLEITEHAIVSDYDKLSATLRPLRQRGLRIAIDDAGAGYASMRHIVCLAPDLIKLDMSLVRSIDKDLARRALARALISFAREIGSRITAEGIETEGELKLLRDLGVDAGQGFFLKEPLSLEEACQASLHRFLNDRNLNPRTLPE